VPAHDSKNRSFCEKLRGFIGFVACNFGGNDFNHRVRHAGG
jgi:hypothetical protein